MVVGPGGPFPVDPQCDEHCGRGDLGERVVGVLPERVQDPFWGSGTDRTRPLVEVAPELDEALEGDWPVDGDRFSEPSKLSAGSACQA